MSEKDNGGPAFPWASYPGMSLRDYFAAQAINTLLDAVVSRQTRPREGQSIGEYIAHEAYELADAMIAERNK